MTQITIRKARRAELNTLITIDDAASTLYSQAGLTFELADDHPFIEAESRRWADAIAAGRAHVASNERDHAIGFIVLSYVDDAPYLDQISVHPDYMRRGVGTQLLACAIRWADEQPLWLTTYSHVPWNRPYYEQHGFRQVAVASCGPGIRSILELQRAALPAPEQRIAMVRRTP
ncbi:MAG: hypothetical protein Hals2KO_11490 [Halioglobus sp.]